VSRAMQRSLWRAELRDDALRVPVRPWRLRAGVGVLLVQAHEQPHQLAAHRGGAKDCNTGKGEWYARFAISKPFGLLNFIAMQESN
jgi:hypothetical protein